MQDYAGLYGPKQWFKDHPYDPKQKQNEYPKEGYGPKQKLNDYPNDGYGPK